jgi:hypothetical protein
MKYFPPNKINQHFTAKRGAAIAINELKDRTTYAEA